MGTEPGREFSDRFSNPDRFQNPGVACERGQGKPQVPEPRLGATPRKVGPDSGSFAPVPRQCPNSFAPPQLLTPNVPPPLFGVKGLAPPQLKLPYPGMQPQMSPQAHPRQPNPSVAGTPQVPNLLSGLQGFQRPPPPLLQNVQGLAPPMMQGSFAPPLK